MKRVLIAAVASSLVTGAVIAATGVAGSGTTKKTTPPPTMAQALKDMQKQRDDHLANIAKRLNISADKLKTAIDKVRKDELDAAVAAKRLTPEQRDAILACKDAPLTCDRSNLPAFGGPGHFHRFGPGMRGAKPNAKRDDFVAALAKELGIDATKVQQAFQAERPKLKRGERGFRRGGPDGPRGFGPPPGGPGGPEGGPGAPGSFVAPAGSPGEPA
jgi:hypothetical protein